MARKGGFTSQVYWSVLMSSVEMLAFIQAQPNIVERLLKHIECSAFVDLIVQIIVLDEHQRCGEVIEVRL